MTDDPDDRLQPQPIGDDEFTAVIRHLNTGAQCTAAKANGDPCTQPVAVAGATVCRIHGGATPQVQAAAVDRLRTVRDAAMEALSSILDTDGTNLDPRVLLDIVTKLTRDIELLEGRATERTEASEFKLEEVRKSLDVRIAALADSYKRAPMVLDMVDQMMGETDDPAA